MKTPLPAPRETRPEGYIRSIDAIVAGEMLFVLVIEQILDPGGEPDAVTDGPGAEDIEQHIACCLGLRIGQRDLVLTGNGLRLHRRRPRRLLVGKTHGQAWRRDTIEIIVDVSAFAPDVAGDCVDPPGTSQIKTRIDIDAVEAGVDICKAQWCRITIHGRDHFLGVLRIPGVASNGTPWM
jgi:hypothetical protein